MVAVGVHVPFSAVNGTPTRAVPRTDGASVLRKVPGATPWVATEVATASSYPRCFTVTRIAMFLRRSSGVGVYAVPVAPVIGAPSASHWKLVLPAGVHLPGSAVSGWSTCATPVTVGGTETVNFPGRTSSVGWDFTRSVL